jgi:predicted nucleotidyltransferase
MLLDELQARKEQINALGIRYWAQRIRVFGSVARREERPDSGVDFWSNYRGATTCLANDWP